MLCISTSKCMLAHAFAWSKTMKTFENHVNQLLGVTPNRWPTNFFFRFSSWALHEPLVRMMEEELFSWFSNVFHCFWPCLVKILNKHIIISKIVSHLSLHNGQMDPSLSKCFNLIFLSNNVVMISWGAAPIFSTFIRES